jgi:hypothetical protein
MSRQKRSPRARTLQRELARADAKLVHARSKLLDLEPGGTPSHPLDVGTAALIEPKARSVPCPRCDVPFSLVSHEAHAHGHNRLRETKLRCRVCGLERSLWFRIVAPS